MRRVSVRFSPRRWLVGLTSMAALSVGSAAMALPGVQGAAISTFDTRGSTVVLAYREGFSAATLRSLSYNANFSATSGNFSAQFGAHYVQFRDAPEAPLAHGAGASGVALFSFPMASRFDNGVPRVAWPLYFGATPAAAISGSRNFLTAPMAIGTGVSLSFAPWLTMTPWIEAAPGVNWDTFINADEVNLETRTRVLPDGSVQTETPDIQAELDKAVDSRLSFDVGMRAGVDWILHLGESWDFNLYSTYGTLGDSFGGTEVVQVGAGLAYHWDDVVPAVLPARQRLFRESCEAVEERFLSCPQYQQLKDRLRGTRSETSLPPSRGPSATPAPNAPPPSPTTTPPQRSPQPAQARPTPSANPPRSSPTPAPSSAPRPAPSNPRSLPPAPPLPPPPPPPPTSGSGGLPPPPPPAAPLPPRGEFPR